MSKPLLLTTLYLLGFEQVRPGITNTSIDIGRYNDTNEDITVEKRIENRYEINLIVGEPRGEPNCTIFVLDFHNIKQNSTAEDVWHMAVIIDEEYDDYEIAHQRLVEIVDACMEQREPPGAVSNLEMAEPLKS